VLLRAEQRANTKQRVQAGDAVMQAALPLVRVASTAMQFRILAMIYRELPDLPSALAFSQRAVALNPIGSRELDTEATVLSDLGRFDDAVRSERAALAFLPENMEDQEILAHLRSYEEKAQPGR
jgi:hypothetical protein